VRPSQRAAITNFWKNSGTSLLFAAALLGPISISRGEEAKPESFDVLTVGPVNYSNVLVQTKTKNDLFIKHASGFANIKVKDLNRSTQLQLGYVIETPVTNAPVRAFTAPKFQIDPRLEEAAEQIVWETREALAPIPRKYIYEAGGILFFFYLLFCNCCRLICRKSANEPRFSALVWLPVFKQIPLLKAAGMNAWFFLLNLLPPLLPILYIVWSFKIARARGKGVGTGWLLLLPVVNLFAFLYLAMSRGAGEPEDDDRHDRGVITLYHDKRRPAA